MAATCLTEFPTRTVAIVLRERIQALYEDLAAMWILSDAWVLNDEDALLPTSIAVRSMYEAYQQLSIPAISISDWLTTLHACSDYLIFDGSWSFALSPPPIF